MMDLADDPTAGAVLDAVPCYPVPPSGRSPAIDALRAARMGHGLAIGHDGVMLIVRRPWLVLDVPVSDRIATHLPYGSRGYPRADLVCGLIPFEHYDRIMAHLLAALPNEAAAFVLWNEINSEFAIEFPAIDEATPSRLVYRPPICAHGWHLVCDIHSHGHGPAFFSATDDADDVHSTKIAMVFGRLDRPYGPTMEARICAGGRFYGMPRNPFAGVHDAA
jgi:PRTRC genetic system protein A